MYRRLGVPHDRLDEANELLAGDVRGRWRRRSSPSPASPAPCAAARCRARARHRHRRPPRGRRAAARADRARAAPADPRLRRRPAGPQAGPRAAPARPRAGRCGPPARGVASTSATPRPTCGWRAPSAPAASGSSRSSVTGTSSSRPAPRRSHHPWPPGSSPPRAHAPGGSRPDGLGPRRAERARPVTPGSAMPWSSPTGRAGPVEALDAAWPGWSDGIDLVVAADGGARHAAALGRRLDLWVGDGDSLGEDGARRAARRGHPDPARWPSTRTRATPSSRSWRPSRPAPSGSRSSARSAAPGSTTASRTSWLLADPRLGRAATSGLVDAAAPDPADVGRGPVRSLGGRPGDLVSLLPFGGDAGRRDHDGPPLPAPRRAARARAVARPVERPRRPRRARRARERPAPRHRNPCYALGDEHPRRRRPRPRDRPPRRDRHGPPPRRPARPLDDPLLLPEGRHARLHRRGVRVPRRERRRSTSAAPTSGGSVRRARASKRAFREKFGLPFTLLADADHAVAEAYGSWVEKQNYGQDLHGRRPDDVPRRSRTAGSPGPGRRSSRRATPPRSSRPSTRRRRRGPPADRR